ncbi:MAG: phage holin family protein [Muribaculaceae bacterium]
MGFILKILISAAAVYLSARILPGIKLKSFGTAILVALVLGILNAVVYPIISLLTLPATIFTIGLFLFVINSVIILMCGAMVRNFEVRGFWYAMLFSIVLSIITGILHLMFMPQEATIS